MNDELKKASENDVTIESLDELVKKALKLGEKLKGVKP